MEGRVSITITADKVVKIEVAEDDGYTESNKEKEGLKRLLKEANGGNDNVAKEQSYRKNTRC